MQFVFTILGSYHMRKRLTSGKLIVTFVSEIACKKIIKKDSECMYLCIHRPHISEPLKTVTEFE
uniref:Uncharacterized protein n=1 Tax=Anguilla anguilla TaxID=7936 RepID=A0A0E9RPD7_ANGAN